MKTLPKNLIARLSQQDLSSKAGFQRLCSRRYRAHGATNGDAEESNKQREKREVS
jgi:hypothetical protein